MAFKEIFLSSTLMVITIINYNVFETEALITVEQINTNYMNVQTDLYRLQQAELMNLMGNSQKLYDLYKEHTLTGRVDKSAVDAAQAELLRNRGDYLQLVMKYLYDTSKFEPAYNYPYGADNYAAPAAASSMASSTASSTVSTDADVVIIT